MMLSTSSAMETMNIPMENRYCRKPTRPLVAHRTDSDAPRTRGSGVQQMKHSTANGMELSIRIHVW